MFDLLDLFVLEDYSWQVLQIICVYIYVIYICIYINIYIYIYINIFKSPRGASEALHPYGRNRPREHCHWLHRTYFALHITARTLLFTAPELHTLENPSRTLLSAAAKLLCVRKPCCSPHRAPREHWYILHRTCFSLESYAMYCTEVAWTSTHAFNCTEATFRCETCLFIQRSSNAYATDCVEPNPLFELSFEITIRNHIALAIHLDARYSALLSSVHEYYWICMDSHQYIRHRAARHRRVCWGNGSYWCLDS